MAKKNSVKAINDIFKRIRNTLEVASDPKSIRPLAKFTIDLIVKRTRLGYGVDRQFGSKQKLKPLSKNYIEYRKSLGGGFQGTKSKKNRRLGSGGGITLSSLTTAGRSNLTLTGQMLDSMQILKEQGTSVTIGPLGQRKGGGPTNEQIADYQAQQGRIFNRVSQLEFNQIIREYRRTFGDLLKKRKLLG